MISSTRQLEAPSANTSPTRDSYTISSSSSPTRVAFSPTMNTPNRPRSGMVPPEVTASRCAPGRPVRVPASRSQTRRGRSSAKSADGYLPASMSSVASNADRGRPANGAVRRTAENHSSTSIDSSAHAATVCCASTSSGLAMTDNSSMAPASIRSTVTALCTRSARCLGNTAARETSPTWWPARPMRCSPDATDGGDSTCTTRSTAPMSMPSSSDEVATTARSRPDLRASSIIARRSLDTDPWCAIARSAGAPRVTSDGTMTCAGGRDGGSGSAPGSVSSAWISLSRAVSRSARRRELTNTIVERCAVTRSTTCRSTCGQIDPWPAVPAGAVTPGAVAVRSVMSSTGTRTVRSKRLSEPGATTATGRSPARNRATSCGGRTVADNPTRWAGASSSASRRSRLSARCAPRLVPATAWISSTITVSTPVRVSLAAEVSSRNSDSGVVTSTCGGRARCRRRSSGGVSPVRMPTVTGADRTPSAAASRAIPASGARRLRSTSTASALRGEMYSTRVPAPAGRSPDPAPSSSRSSAARNADSVFPEPVGATTSVSPPPANAPQAPSWAGVGRPNAPRNHDAVAGWKRSSASDMNS